MYGLLSLECLALTYPGTKGHRLADRLRFRPAPGDLAGVRAGVAPGQKLVDGGLGVGEGVIAEVVDCGQRG